MMRQSLPPAMNRDSVLEGRLKCRVARNGERRSELSEDREWLGEGETVADSRDVDSRDAGLVSSGCLMTTHS